LVNLLTDGTLPTFDVIGKTKEQIHNQGEHVLQLMSVAKGLMDDHGITVKNGFKQTFESLKNVVENSGVINAIGNTILLQYNWIKSG
jgi:hypothetical protein